MKSTTLLAALFLLLASPGFSADPKPGEAPKAPAKTDKPAATPAADAKAMHLPFRGTVVEVTPRTLTLNSADGKDARKFKTNKDTEIAKGDSPAKHEDIKVGMEVTGSFVREGDTDTITKLQLKPGK